ncbi:MAG: hypothetical protein MUD08_00065 [Cytophagales bacterium]|jgi:hypothetical protein|nr:hypothetical protein [Cytophagales bacterium]
MKPNFGKSEEPAADDYEFDVMQLTVAQANTYRLLLEVAGRLLETKDTNPLVGGAFPETVAKGWERAYYRLLAFKPLFDRIINGRATEADLEYYQMKQGLRSHNRHLQQNRAA